ncbi:MAG: glycosyltransferase family 2 protein [Bacteroidia bacterium]|nr:glycosyltransferase family 2 protein [Bacteroidia bacterium]
MKITGFTFIRNAVKFDYPVVEAIKSILPICNDFVVAVGKSDDSTLDLIQSIDKQKIKIFETIWDDSPEMKIGGKVLAVETDKAFQAIPDDSDWAFYIQGDEVIHEKYLDNIYSSMERWKDNKLVDGLLFNFLHFYGSYDYVGISPKWYNHEIRVIKNDNSIYSYRDAQGFRKGENKKLNVKPVDAYVYHYGWVKEPQTMMKKIKNSYSFYHKIDFVEKKFPNQMFDYSSIDALRKFTETPPQVMQERIARKNWSFDYDISFNKLSLRYKGKIFLKKYLGINTYYENYHVI